MKEDVFYANDSEMHIDNLTLEEISLEMESIYLHFLDLDSAKLYGKNIKLQNIKGYFTETFIVARNSFIIIENIEINGFLIENGFVFLQLLQQEQNLIHLFNSILLNECHIINIITKYRFSFLVIEEKFNAIIVNNSIFKNIKSYHYLIFIKEFSKVLFVENLIFSQNFVLSNIFTNLVQTIQMKNISCLSNNHQGNVHYHDGFSCFKLSDVTFLKIEKMNIVNCISYQSALLLISTSADNNLLTEGFILIYESGFISNRFNITISQDDIGGAVKIITQYNIIFETSIFIDNILESDKVSFPHGPCMKIVSNNLVEIKNSKFERNKSSKLTNCIYCISKILNITDSFFFNNSISFLTEEDFRFLNETRETGEFFFDVAESKGGAIIFIGKTLFILNSKFLFNKANVGSALYLEDDQQNRKMATIIKIESSFFYKNQALWGSTLAFNFLLSFEATLTKNIVANNVAYHGAAMLLRLMTTATLFLLSNIFLENVANFCPVINLEIGPLMIIGKHNIFRKNLASAIVGKAGGLAYMIGPGGVFYLENEIYVENMCYQGVVSLFHSKGFEKNSLYWNNLALFVSGIATSDYASYYGDEVKFIRNSAGTFGCINSLDTSQISFNKAVFYNLSSQHKGACLLIQDLTELIVTNSIFYMNYLNSESIIELRNTAGQSIFRNCTFFKNYVASKFFDILFSSVFFDTTFFYSNSGNLFSFLGAQAIFKQGRFNQINSNENMIYAESSELTLSFTYFSLISMKESLIFSFYSNFSSDQCLTYKISVPEKGSFINAAYSQINIKNLNTSDSNSNCLYFYFSKFEFSNSYHMNFGSEKSEGKKNLGVLYASFCELIYMEKNVFIQNQTQFKPNRFIYLLYNPNPVRIIKCYFLNGFSLENGGAIKVIDSIVIISGCFFKRNKALKGGSIFLNLNDSKFLFDL